MADYLFQRIGFPDVLLLILLGFILGPGLAGIVSGSLTDNIMEITPYVAGVALAIILFDAGLGLDLGMVFGSLRHAVLHTLLEFFLSIVIVAVIASVLLGWDLILGLTLGTIIGGTSGAIVIPMVKRMRMTDKARTILTLEAAITDVLVIVIAIFLIFWTFGTLDFGGVFEQAGGMPVEQQAGVLTAIGLLLLAGATGKSAQVPLYVWLPDAMEGPTPVSALIHAATMVTAGVYMVARSAALYLKAPIALDMVGYIGLFTAVLAATIGLLQNDIKKVFAYSTVSQLGYMFVGLGAGAFSAGIFHLVTHAFFKALLFLGAGSVIHALSGEQDLRRMGGLRKKIPLTFWTLVCASVAIAGVPPFSGFFSKDEILLAAHHHAPWMYWVGVATAGMTAFYMFRLLFVTFHGECRAAEEVKHHIHESPKVMTIPLVILAFLSIVGGWVGIPHVLGGGNHIEKWMEPVFAGSGAGAAATHAGSGWDFSLVTNAFASHGGGHGGEGALEIQLMILAVIIGLIGIFAAYLVYVRFPGLSDRFVKKFHGLFVLVNNKYWVDEIYHGITYGEPGAR